MSGACGCVCVCCQEDAELVVTDVAAKYDQHPTPPLCTPIIPTRTMLHTAMSKAGVCLAVLLRRLYVCLL